jgi:hypothetical protein
VGERGRGSRLRSGRHGSVAQYKFDETGGPTLIDSSGNSRNGTIVLGGGAAATTTATDAQTADRFWQLNRVDITAPVVNLACPADPVLLGSDASATWTAVDERNGSGLETPAEGPIPLDTASVGTKTATAPAGTAIDVAGNASIEASPIGSGDVVNSVKAGSSVPVTETAGGSGFSYDAHSHAYTCVWETSKSWEGTSGTLRHPP